MPRLPRSILPIALVTLGWWAGSVLRPTALAAPGDIDPAIRCRTFGHPLDGAAVIDTNDATSELGAWVAEQRGDAWRVHGVDFELAQKSTGFPQGYVQVCMTR